MSVEGKSFFDGGEQIEGEILNKLPKILKIILNKQLFKAEKEHTPRSKREIANSIQEALPVLPDVTFVKLSKPITGQVELCEFSNLYKNVGLFIHPDGSANVPENRGKRGIWFDSKNNVYHLFLDHHAKDEVRSLAPSAVEQSVDLLTAFYSTPKILTNFSQTTDFVEQVESLITNKITISVEFIAIKDICKQYNITLAMFLEIRKRYFQNILITGTYADPDSELSKVNFLNLKLCNAILKNQYTSANEDQWPDILKILMADFNNLEYYPYPFNLLIENTTNQTKASQDLLAIIQSLESFSHLIGFADRYLGVFSIEEIDFMNDDHKLLWDYLRKVCFDITKNYQSAVSQSNVTHEVSPTISLLQEIIIKIFQVNEFLSVEKNPDLPFFNDLKTILEELKNAVEKEVHVTPQIETNSCALIDETARDIHPEYRSFLTNKPWQVIINFKPGGQYTFTVICNKKDVDIVQKSTLTLTFFCTLMNVVENFFKDENEDPIEIWDQAGPTGGTTYRGSMFGVFNEGLKREIFESVFNICDQFASDLDINKDLNVRETFANNEKKATIISQFLTDVFQKATFINTLKEWKLSATKN